MITNIYITKVVVLYIQVQELGTHQIAFLKPRGGLVNDVVDSNLCTTDIPLSSNTVAWE